MKKKILAVILSALILSSTVIVLGGCGCDSDELTATADTAMSASEKHEAESSNVTAPTLSKEEQAIVNSGLKVDDKGNIVDENGKKLETKDGKVEVKTADGKTVTISADEVKSANNKTNNANNSGLAENGSAVSKTNNNNSSANKKPADNSSSSAASSKPNNSTQTNNKPASSTEKKPESSTADPHAGKTYHEAVYKTVNHPAETKVVNHPAETKKVKVVDKEAYTYEEPVYETQYKTICLTCGADITGNTTPHNRQHALNGENANWGTRKIEVQVGTKTVTVPEEYHYETKVVKEAWTETVVVKEAWTEKVLVKEAGWY